MTGVDISEKMIHWLNERAKRDGVGNSVEFRLADAQDPPFEEAIFDVVIGESVASCLKARELGLGKGAPS